MTQLRLGTDCQYEEAGPTSAGDLDRLLSRFDVLSIRRPVATIIATLRRAGQPLDDLHDAYIAATVRTRDLPVLTATIDHSDQIDDHRAVDWETF